MTGRNPDSSITGTKCEPGTASMPRLSWKQCNLLYGIDESGHRAEDQPQGETSQHHEKSSQQQVTTWNPKPPFLFFQRFPGILGG